MTESIRYKLIRSTAHSGSKKHLILSPTSFKILQALKKAGCSVSYTDLIRATKIPIDSLYVFCQRLERVGMIERVKKQSGTPRRIKTEVTLKRDFEILDMKMVR